MSLSKLQEIVKDKKAWGGGVGGSDLWVCKELDMTEQLNNNKPLVRLIKQKLKVRAQINIIRNEKGMLQWTSGNTNDHKILLQATIYQLNGQTGRNGKIPRKV